MKQVTFVTGNPEKARNFSRQMGADIPHHNVDVDEIQTLDVYKIVEHKAKEAYKQLKTPVLVEDVQFSMNVLGNLPGPFIKYFVLAENGGEKMCRMLDGFKDRGVTESCVYGYFDGKTMQYFESELRGVAAEHPKGEQGYGFDRIFIADGFGGRTAGELDEKEYDEYYSVLKPFAKVKQFLEEA